MFYSEEQVLKAVRALDDARRTFQCNKPRLDDAGGAHGTHDAAYLQVDPITGVVRCGACAGDLAVVVAPKVRVDVPRRKGSGGRPHLVSAHLVEQFKAERGLK